MKTLNEAKSAKLSALALLAPLVDLTGIGIAGSPDEGYHLSVQLRTEVSDYSTLPQQIDGVKLAYRFVGCVTPSGTIDLG